MIASASCSVLNPLRAGQIITVPKGTPLRSTHPRRNGVYHARRALTVRLHSVSDGYVDLWDDAKQGRGFVWLPTVTWLGSGGYYVDLKVTPEVCHTLGVAEPTLPVIHEYDRKFLDVEPGFGLGYDNRDG